MSMFTKDELDKINKANDLHIAPYRTDGKTYGTPTWIWEVVVDGNLYVRAYNGIQSKWYQAAIQQKDGKIIAANMTKEVVFTPENDTNINLKIDEAYKTKYNSSPYLAPMISNKTKEATIKINPK